MKYGVKSEHKICFGASFSHTSGFGAWGKNLRVKKTVRSEIGFWGSLFGGLGRKIQVGKNGPGKLSKNQVLGGEEYSISRQKFYPCGQVAPPDL